MRPAWILRLAGIQELDDLLAELLGAAGLAFLFLRGELNEELFLALVFPALGLLAEEGVVFGLLVFVCNYLAVVLAGFVAWQVSPPPFEADLVDPE